MTEATGGALRGVVMEDIPDHAAEEPHEKFHRLETEFEVVGYIFVYPRDSNTDGTRVEEGMLLRDMARGEDVRIVVVAETGVIAERDGDVYLLEQGRRTTYTVGLLTRATNVYLGKSLEDMPGLVEREARFMLEE